MQFIPIATKNTLLALHYPVHLTSQQVKCGKNLINALKEPKSSLAQLQAAYHKLLLSLVTTQRIKGLEDRFHSPLEIFIISSSIGKDGTFQPVHLISSAIAKISYSALYAMLYDCIHSDDAVE